MLTKVTNAKDRVYLSGEEKAPAETTQKTTNVYDQNVSNSAQTPIESEREYYISKFMEEQGVTREVAAAQYDFYT